MKRVYVYYQKSVPFILALVLSVLFMLPMLHKGLPNGHDLLYHLSRVMGSYELLNVGVFPAKILPGFYFDYGYAVGLFYPTALLYIPVFLMKLGLNIIPAYLVFIFLINYFTTLSMYYATLKITKSQWIAIVASVLYVLATYRTYSDFYTRQALGEFIGMMFIPIVFSAMYDIIWGDVKYWPILTIGMVGLITSHTLSTILISLYLTLLVVFNLHRFIHQPKRLGYLVLAALMTLGLTSNYLLSMWQMMKSDTFQYMEPWTLAMWNAVSELKAAFYGFWVVSKFPYGLDYITAVIVLMGSFIYAKRIFKSAMLGFMVVAGVISLALTSTIVTPDVTELMNFMQFPWRLFIFITFFSSVLAAYILNQIPQTWVRNGLAFLLVVYTMASYLGFSNAYMEHHPIYTDFPGYSPYHASAEFIPLDANMNKLIARSFKQQVVSNNEINYTYKREADSYTIYFSENTKSDSILEVPLLYYRGYAAYITSPQGNAFLDISDNDNALISVKLADYKEGTIRVFYNGTKLQKYSQLFNLVFYFVFMIVLIYPKAKKYILRKFRLGSKKETKSI